jgi:hypothetical protein
MDTIVEKIFEVAANETSSPESCRQAIIRAGQIAQAYNFVDSDLLGSVFGSRLVSGVNNILENDRDKDASSRSN